jgi:YbgC/YbaW family acyl-CoA thioester hydrolase
MPPFITHRRVEFADTDMAGIVHFSNFFKWMEEAEHEYFRSLGFSIMEPQADGKYIGWPRVSASCNYERPIFYQDRIELRVSVERVGVKSISYAIEIWRDADRIATGRMKVACCLCGLDHTLESIEIPEGYRLKLPPEKEWVA